MIKDENKTKLTYEILNILLHITNIFPIKHFQDKSQLLCQTPDGRIEIFQAVAESFRHIVQFFVETFDVCTKSPQFRIKSFRLLFQTAKFLLKVVGESFELLEF